MEIKKTNDIDSHRVTALIYGDSGIGKTMLASTLMEKLLFISCESGTLSLKDYPIDVVEVKSISNLREILAHLKNSSEYKTIYIDSLTEISQVLVTELEKTYPDKKDALKLWGDYSKQLRAIVKAFRDLAPYNVFITSLAKVEKDEVGRRFIIPDVNGKIAQQLAQYFDEVFYMTSIQKEKTIERVLITSSSEQTMAKDRSGKLDKIEQPNLQNILNKIKGD